MKLSPDVLKLDAAAEIGRINRRLREILAREVPRRGFVVAMSGGIDSSLSVALCVGAIGAGRVLGLLLPERDSSPSSADRAQQLARFLGIRTETQDITSALQSLGCYRWRDDAIRRVHPEYDDTWKSKIVIAGGLEGRFNHFRLVVQEPTGRMHESPLGLREYLQIVAATNFKQRIRKTVEYCQADRLNYAVVGTPNRLEYDQGFFVKNGDGSADVKPIAHLYKSQVYALASHLGLPADVCNATPSTDTYSLPQGQDEFYFALPYQQMDLALWALNNGCDAGELAEALGIDASMAERVYADMRAKRRAARYLHAGPSLVDAIQLSHG